MKYVSCSQIYSRRENGLFDKKSVRDYSHCLKFERKGGNELQDKCKMNIANYAKQRNSESEKAISLNI